MLKHPIIGLLKTFSNEEKKSLSEFMASPYFVKSRRVKELHREIIKCYPLFAQEDLSKEKLSKKLYNGVYKELAIRKLLHELLQIVLNFLAHNKFRSADYIRDDYILKELMIRNQKKLFKKYSEKTESEFKNVKSINAEYFLNRHIFESNKFNYNILNKKVLKKLKAEEIKEISEFGKYFILFFLTEILNENIELFFTGNEFNLEFEKLLLHKFIGNIDMDSVIKNFTEDEELIFILKIYYSMYKAFLNFDKEEYYYEYKFLLLEHINRISYDEITKHFYNLVNYCTLKNKSTFKRNEFEPELMNLYELIINNEYYTTDKVIYLPNDLFRNILFVSLRHRKFKWSYKFVKEYSRKLNPDDIENMYNYGNAYLLFEEKRYELSLDYLNRVSLENFNYKFDEKNMRLRIFFELGYFDQVPGLIHAYYENLRYSKLISKERKNRHRNFLSYLEKMVKYKTGNMKIDISFLKHKIIEEDQILYKEWLLEKIEEIEVGVPKKE